jgi:hypothetical protein
MPWTPIERAYFFGAECAHRNGEVLSDEECALVSHVRGADQAFIDRYCSVGSAMHPGTKSRLGTVAVATARCVLNRLAEILPDWAHATPGLWTPQACPQPIIVIGKMYADGRIAHRCQSNGLLPRIGLCAVDGHLFLFADKDTILAFGFAVAGWVPWRTGVLRYEQSLDCDCRGEPSENHPLSSGQPLCVFLDRFNQDLRNLKTALKWKPSSEGLAERRVRLVGRPDFTSICPRLIELHISERKDNKHTRKD